MSCTSLVLRVTSVSPCAIAVAASNVSMTGLGRWAEGSPPYPGCGRIDSEDTVGEAKLQAVDPRAKYCGSGRVGATASARCLFSNSPSVRTLT